MRTKAGTEMRTKEGTEKKIKEGTEKRTKEGTEKRIKEGTKKRTKAEIPKETEMKTKAGIEMLTEAEITGGTEMKTKAGTEMLTKAEITGGTEIKTKAGTQVVTGEGTEMTKKKSPETGGPTTENEMVAEIGAGPEEIGVMTEEEVKTTKRETEARLNAGGVFPTTIGGGERAEMTMPPQHDEKGRGSEEAAAAPAAKTRTTRGWPTGRNVRGKTHPPKTTRMIGNTK